MGYRFNVGQKGLLVVCIPLFFEVFFVVLLLNLLTEINWQIQREENARTTLGFTHDFGRVTIDASALIAAISIHPEAGMQARLDDLLQRADADLSKLRALLATEPLELKSLDSMKESLDTAKNSLDLTHRQVNGMDSLFLVYTNPELRKAAKIFGRVNTAIQQLVAAEESKAEQSLRSVERSKRLVEQVMLAAFIGSVVLTACLAFFFNRSIAERIALLGRNASFLAARKPLACSLSGLDEVSALDAALHRTDRELAQLEVARRNLVAFVAHELRTPLASISSIFSLLEAGIFMPLDDRGIHAAASASLKLKHLNDLISDLIDIERMDGGKFLLLLSDVDIPTFVESLVQKWTLLLAQVDAGKIELRVGKVDDLIVMCDRDRLLRVFVNLLNNVSKRTPPGAVVEVQAKQEAGWIDFSITSVGAALPTYLRECVYDRTQFADDKDSLDIYVNDALPLIISRMIIEQHGGLFDIRMDSQQQTTFLCRLPLSS